MMASAQHTFDTIAPSQSWITNLKPLQAKQASKHVNFGNWTQPANHFNIIQPFKTNWEESNINL